jgi:PPM family protein phosphatase
MKYAFAREQRIGMRHLNQDRAGHVCTEEAMLLAVADGMSGYDRGELAAEIAVASLSHAFLSEATPKLPDPGPFLERGIGGAHFAIRRYAEAQALRQAPRTVLVACVVQDGCAWWNHVGDARLYLVREGRIEACTRDHTGAQALLDAGRIGEEEEAAVHPERNRMLQSLGGPLAPVPGPGASAPLRKHDILLLCSDGFWAPLGASRLVQGLSVRPLEASIDRLCNVAERRAGTHADNLTVLAMIWDE